MTVLTDVERARLQDLALTGIFYHSQGALLQEPFGQPAPSRCFFCGKSDVPIVCGRCQLERYCSDECQRQDEARHKGECVALDDSLAHFRRGASRCSPSLSFNSRSDPCLRIFQLYLLNHHHRLEEQARTALSLPADASVALLLSFTAPDGYASALPQQTTHCALENDDALRQALLELGAATEVIAEVKDARRRLLEAPQVSSAGRVLFVCLNSPSSVFLFARQHQPHEHHHGHDHANPHVH